MKLFDAHVHVFPDKVAAKAVAMLAKSADLPPYTDGTRAGLIDSIAAAGIAGAMNCPIATAPDQVDSINRWAVANNRWPMLSLGTVHPQTPDPKSVLESVRDGGLAGIKLHPEYQDFTPDDDAMQPVWEICTELNLAVMIHCGGDRAFGAPFRSDPARIAALSRRYPRLRLAAAHLGGFEMWEDVDNHLIGTDIYLDISFTLDYMPRQHLLDRCRRHGMNRVLFATDSPWKCQAVEAERTRELPLPRDQRDALGWRNAFAFYGLPEALMG